MEVLATWGRAAAPEPPPGWPSTAIQTIPLSVRAPPSARSEAPVHARQGDREPPPGVARAGACAAAGAAGGGGYIWAFVGGRAINCLG